MQSRGLLTLVAFFIGLMCASHVVFGQTYQNYGAGTSICQELIIAKKGMSDKKPEADILVDAAKYTQMISWIQGYLTGTGKGMASEAIIWDALVRRPHDADVDASRRAYCEQTPADLICGIWRQGPQQGPPRPVLRPTIGDEIVRWAEKYCAEHAQERLTDAVEKLTAELLSSRSELPNSHSNMGALPNEGSGAAPSPSEATSQNATEKTWILWTKVQHTEQSGASSIDWHIREVYDQRPLCLDALKSDVSTLISSTNAHKTGFEAGLVNDSEVVIQDRKKKTTYFHTFLCLPDNIDPRSEEKK